MAENCIFCKIIKGEIPSSVVYEDEEMVAFKDVAPAAPVHVLLLPKKHVENVTSCPAQLLSHLLSKVGPIAQQLGVAEKGFRLVINTGADGGQTVPHLHIHLIGGAELGWPPC